VNNTSSFPDLQYIRSLPNDPKTIRLPFDEVYSCSTLSRHCQGHHNSPMLPISLTSLPFILHILVETPAAFTFALFPSSTLLRLQPDAHGVIRQYGLLLLSTNIIASLFAFQGHERKSIDDQFWQIEAWVAGSFALYHVGPLMRAGSRIWRGGGRRRSFVAQPWVHAIAHAVCLIALAGRSLHCW